MQLNTEVQEVTVVGQQTTGHFKIAMNAKAFKVLSSTLYADKISSIVREISCNAYDSHVAARKKEIPFEIHVPDAFEPWFSVRDFGTGLSSKMITEVFSVFFNSTKDQSNEYLGAYGIGSKTPFSYTDQFTVTSVYNGQRSIYSAFITETGMPSISLMFSEETEEENGVEVKLSAKSQDYSKFVNAVFDQLQFFAVKPVIKNLSMNREFSTREYVIDTDSVKIGGVGGYYTKQYIIQGNVGYPLDLSKISDRISKESSDFISTMQSTHVEMYFDIGQIGVTASREAIEYDNTTAANIDTKIKQIIEYLKDYVENQVSKLTKWEQAKLMNSSRSLRYIASACGNSTVEYFNLKDISYNDQGTRVADVHIRHAARSKFMNNYSTATSKIIPKDDPILIVIQDTNSMVVKRIEKIIDGMQKAPTVYRIVPWNMKGIDLDKFEAHVKESLGDYDGIIRLSTIDIPKVERQKKAKSTIPEYYIANWERRYDEVSEIEEEYVWAKSDGLSTVDSIESYLNARRYDETMPALILIPKRNWEDASNNENLTHINKYLESKKEELRNDRLLKLKQKRNSIKNRIRESIYNIISESNIRNLIKTELPNSNIVRLLNIYENMNTYDHVNGSVAHALGININTESKANFKHIMTKYPLYNLVVSSTYVDGDSAKHLVDYIKMVDAQEKQEKLEEILA